MGKGDKKTKKGKRFLGSYGNVRPRKDESKVFILKKKATPKVEVKEEKTKTTKKPKKTTKKTTSTTKKKK